jgi:subtilisin family serine protease
MRTSVFCRTFTALLLTYLFVISSFSPLAGLATTNGRVNPGRTMRAQTNAPQRAGELLVRFRAGVSKRERETIIATHGARKKEDLKGESGVERLELSPGGEVQTTALQMLMNPQVEFAEPNFLIAKDDSLPNDARFVEQWGLRNTGQSGGQHGSDVNAARAWTTTTGSKSTVIAVIDSGIDFSHPDLVNNQWFNPVPESNGDLRGWDFVTNSAEITDEQGHGTTVAGIIAAEGNNAIGMTGLMWRASLMSLRVLDGTGIGDVADAVEAIDYAAAHGAQVINLSWGTSGESVALKDAIQRAIRRNVVVVCSAGNGGRDLDNEPYYPASFGSQGLIAVAATDSFDRLAVWSNWGVKSVTVAAPGTDILATQVGGGYRNVSGTSAAAPLVSGIAGLLKTLIPAANPQSIARAVSQSARKTASLSSKVDSGGVADAQGALDRLRGPQNQRSTFVPGLGSGGNGSGGSFSTAPPPSRSGAPGLNLPNLR